MKNKQLSDLLVLIPEADDGDIQEIMDAVRQWYYKEYPDWDVIYMAAHKDPALRKEDFSYFISMLEKDLAWSEMAWLEKIHNE